MCSIYLMRVKLTYLLNVKFYKCNSTWRTWVLELYSSFTRRKHKTDECAHKKQLFVHTFESCGTVLDVHSFFVLAMCYTRLLPVVLLCQSCVGATKPFYVHASDIVFDEKFYFIIEYKVFNTVTLKVHQCLQSKNT